MSAGSVVEPPSTAGTARVHSDSGPDPWGLALDSGNGSDANAETGQPLPCSNAGEPRPLVRSTVRNVRPRGHGDELRCPCSRTSPSPPRNPRGLCQGRAQQPEVLPRRPVRVACSWRNRKDGVLSQISPPFPLPLAPDEHKPEIKLSWAPTPHLSITPTFP